MKINNKGIENEKRERMLRVKLKEKHALVFKARTYNIHIYIHIYLQKKI